MDTEIERAKDYKIIVLDNHVIMTDNELYVFRNFVADGGTIIFSADTGTRDTNGRRRSCEAMQQAWGVVISPVSTSKKLQEYPFKKGKYLLAPKGFSTISPMGTFVADRWQNPSEKIIYHDDLTKNLPTYQRLANLLLEIIDHDADLITENLPFGILVTMFQTVSDRLAVHLVNTAGTFDITPGTLIGHEDLMPYPDFVGEAVLQVRIPEFATGKNNVSGRLLRYNTEEIILKVERITDFIKICIPLAALKDYALIEITFI